MPINQISLQPTKIPDPNAKAPADPNMKLTAVELNELITAVRTIIPQINDITGVTRTVSTEAPSGIPGDNDEWIIYQE